MAETATKESPNKVTITDAGPSRKKIAIEVPAEAVAAKLAESMDTLSVEAQVPGFRKGRAPRKLLERRFGESIRAETKHQIIASAYADAVEEHKLKVIGEPSADVLDKIELTDDKPLSFELEVEVLPEFELPSLEGIQVVRPVLEVSDQMVADEIEKVLVNEGDLEPQEKPAAGDYLTGHGVMTNADGTEFYNIESCVVQIPPKDKKGKGMILGVLVEDLGKQLGLPKAGETATIKTKGPENHEVEAIRGAELTITFKVERVDRIVPAAMEDVVSRFGFETEQELRDAMRRRLEQRAMVRQQVAMRQQAARHLMESTQLDLPEQVTASQAARTLERRSMELMYRGVSQQEIEEHMAELRAASHEIAVRELKLFFILNRAAEQLNVQVDEAEVNGRIAQLAFERDVRPERLRQELIQRNQINSVIAQIREHKTIDVILGMAQITDVPADQFEQQTGMKIPG
jgi:trigger factor